MQLDICRFAVDNNLDPEACRHEAGANDTNTSWYRLDYCKAIKQAAADLLQVARFRSFQGSGVNLPVKLFVTLKLVRKLSTRSKESVAPQTFKEMDWKLWRSQTDSLVQQCKFQIMIIHFFGNWLFHTQWKWKCLHSGTKSSGWLPGYATRSKHRG